MSDQELDEPLGQPAQPKHAFAQYNLTAPLYNAIRKQKIYKPTPIQKKSLPTLLEGNDAIISSKTGSGKTLCYLLPLINKLQSHSKTVGARALILAPTKQLALQITQTLKQFVQQTTLKYSLILGGFSYDGQFEKLASNPDVIVATPGRLMQLVEETGLTLGRLEFVAVDQADLMFEMGFGDQIRRILQKTPKARQTVLVSATIPQELGEFANSGLRDYRLIKTAVQIPSTLKLNFLITRGQERLSTLFYLLQQVVGQQSCLIFCSTRYVVEFLVALLTKMMTVSVEGLHGKMDSSIRAETMAKFCKEGGLLVVTDVAARGIDLPFIQTVIHYDYPSNSKIFIHRSGRTARAGRHGQAYCLITASETPYMCEISHLTERDTSYNHPLEDCSVISYGSVPSQVGERHLPSITKMVKDDPDIAKMEYVMGRGMQRFLKTRTSANGPAAKQASKCQIFSTHQLFGEGGTAQSTELEQFLSRIKKYVPKKSYLQLAKEKALPEDQIAQDPFMKAVMKIKETKLASSRTRKIRDQKQDRQDQIRRERKLQQVENIMVEDYDSQEQAHSQEQAKNISSGKRSLLVKSQFYLSSEKPKKSVFDDENRVREDTSTWFADEEAAPRAKRATRVWDKDKKDFKFRVDSQDKLSKDRKGQKAYQKWQKKYQLKLQKEGEEEDTERVRKGEFFFMQRRKFRHGYKENSSRGQSQLKTRGQIVNKKIKKSRQQK